MKDVTAKSPTLREALAEAKITMPPEIQAMLRERRLEKGDALEIARVAGVMAAKKTWEIIPFCHPLPITGVEITYEHEPDGVRVRARVSKSIRMICCQVPSVSRPATNGTLSDGPSSDARTCEWPLSSCQVCSCT